MNITPYTAMPYQSASRLARVGVEPKIPGGGEEVLKDTITETLQLSSKLRQAAESMKNTGEKYRGTQSTDKGQPKQQ